MYNPTQFDTYRIKVTYYIDAEFQSVWSKQWHRCKFIDESDTGKCYCHTSMEQGVFMVAV